MKKTYISPTAETIKMQMAVLAPASAFGKESDPSKGINDESGVLGHSDDFDW